MEASKKSFAFRMLLQDTEKTLTDAEADLGHCKTVDILESEFGASFETIDIAGPKAMNRDKREMTLTKAELADLLFEKVGLNKREAKDMVESFYEEVRIALQNGDGVKLSGFGNFQLRDKPQRPGRNPKNRRRNSDYCTARGNISCQSEIKGNG